MDLSSFMKSGLASKVVKYLRRSVGDATGEEVSEKCPCCITSGSVSSTSVSSASRTSSTSSASVSSGSSSDRDCDGGCNNNYRKGLRCGMWVDTCGTITWDAPVGETVSITPDICGLSGGNYGTINNAACDAYNVALWPYPMKGSSSYLHVTCSGWVLHIPEGTSDYRKLIITNTSNTMDLEIPGEGVYVNAGSTVEVPVERGATTRALTLKWSTPTVLGSTTYSIGSVAGMFMLDPCEETSSSESTSSVSSSESTSTGSTPSPTPTPTPGQSSSESTSESGSSHESPSPEPHPEPHPEPPPGQGSSESVSSNESPSPVESSSSSGCECEGTIVDLGGFKFHDCGVARLMTTCPCDPTGLYGDGRSGTVDTYDDYKSITLDCVTFGQFYLMVNCSEEASEGTISEVTLAGFSVEIPAGTLVYATCPGGTAMYPTNQWRWALSDDLCPMSHFYMSATDSPIDLAWNAWDTRCQISVGALRYPTFALCKDPVAVGSDIYVYGEGTWNITPESGDCAPHIFNQGTKWGETDVVGACTAGTTSMKASFSGYNIAVLGKGGEFTVTIGGTGRFQADIGGAHINDYPPCTYTLTVTDTTKPLSFSGMWMTDENEPYGMSTGPISISRS